MMAMQIKKSVPKTVLSPEAHERIIKDLANVATDANIVPQTLERSMVGLCSEAEIKYAKAFRRHANDEMFGLALTGTEPSAPIIDRFGVTAAALVRNFIRARVVTLNQFVNSSDDLEGYSCVLVPNFFLSKSMGGSLAQWKTGDLLDVLIQRQTVGKQTIVYVSDMDALANEYGEAIRQHLVSNFYVAKA